MVAQRFEDIPAPQAFRNGEIHDWYRTVWGYSDHLVARLIDDHRSRDMRVIDPFCGSGTTLVECMKHGVFSAGLDANPVSVFAARVKTSWSLRPERLEAVLAEVEDRYANAARYDLRSDTAYAYLRDSGMLHRGWISVEPLRKLLALSDAIRRARTTSQYRNALMLALLDTAVRDASNVRFGPELYCGAPRRYVRILDRFRERVCTMIDDLEIAKNSINAKAASIVVEGDARSVADLVALREAGPYSHVICSPPYPAEHDYTRNSRLELALLGSVDGLDALRVIKKRMVRSHTKGIYLEDRDAGYAAGYRSLERLTKEIDGRAGTKQHGFAKLYSRVMLEYFGGMVRHLISVRPLLRDRAILAYVVGDQSSYLQVPIPTAKIISELASDHGYRTVEIRHWRTRLTRSRVKTINENVLVLEKS